MSDFSSILGQKQPLRILTAFLGKRTIPHALLFTGIKGVGKQTVALAFAKACNCTALNEPSRILSNRQHSPDSAPADAISCGCCKSCRKIDAGSHPDVIRVSPQGVHIKIAQIRDLCHTLSMRPYEAEHRVVIISEAPAMNPSAGNALLKVLEEPPDRTVLILTAEQPSDLLPTIVSRCQHIRFKPTPVKVIEDSLNENNEDCRAQAPVIAAMANGSHSGALEMLRRNWFARRTWLLAQMVSLSGQSPALVMALAEKLSKNKETLGAYLDIILSWLRDIVIFAHAPEKIIHKDLTDNIRYASQRMDVSRLLGLIQDVQSVQGRIRANANPRLAVEALLLKMADT